MTVLRHIIRFVVAAIVLMITSAIVPGFQIAGFWSALLAAVVIAILGWIIESLMGREISPYGRGIVGFIVSAVVIYLTQFFVPGLRVTFLGALLGALVIGIIDLLVPTKARITSRPEKQ